MADDTEPLDEGAATDDTAGGNWLRQFVILAVLVLICQSVVAYVLVSRQILPQFGEEDGQTLKEAEVTDRDLIEITPPLMFSFDEMVVNPLDDGVIRYLNTKISMEVDIQEALDLLKENQVVATKVEDLVRQTLKMTPYRDMDQVSERKPLKAKLLARLNGSELLGEAEVLAIYFERFILQ